MSSLMSSRSLGCAPPPPPASGQHRRGGQRRGRGLQAGRGLAPTSCWGRGLSAVGVGGGASGRAVAGGAWRGQRAWPTAVAVETATEAAGRDPGAVLASPLARGRPLPAEGGVATPGGGGALPWRPVWRTVWGPCAGGGCPRRSISGSTVSPAIHPPPGAPPPPVPPRSPSRDAAAACPQSPRTPTPRRRRRCCWWARRRGGISC